MARLQQALSVFFLSGACARNNRALVERVALFAGMPSACLIDLVSRLVPIISLPGE